jgi:Leucine-rich repeat (LRR) protein
VSKVALERVKCGQRKRRVFELFAISLLFIFFALSCRAAKVEKINRKVAEELLGSSSNGPSEMISTGKLRKPEINRGLIYYNGQKPDNVKLESMNDLLQFYLDEELLEVIEISWSSCRFTRIEGLGRLPNLKILQLGNNRIAAILGLEKVPLLENINLSQNNIGQMEGLEGLPNLRELYLGRNRIKKIEGLESLEKLEVLMLEGNEITEISGLSKLRSLKRLGLAGNKLRDIRGLLELEALEEVSIESSTNQLDDGTMQFIRDWNARHADKPGLQLRSGMPGRQE